MLSEWAVVAIRFLLGQGWNEPLRSSRWQRKTVNTIPFSVPDAVPQTRALGKARLPLLRLTKAPPPALAGWAFSRGGARGEPQRGGAFAASLRRPFWRSASEPRSRCRWFLIFVVWRRRKALSVDRAALARIGGVANVSVCSLVVGVVLVQCIFTLKRKTGRRKTKIIEMIQCRDNILSVTSLEIFVFVLAFLTRFYLRLQISCFLPPIHIPNRKYNSELLHLLKIKEDCHENHQNP